MRALALDDTAVDFDEDDATVDGPPGEEGSHEGHLGERDGSQSVESIPREITRLAIRLLLFGGHGSRVPRKHLAQEVHQSEQHERDHGGDDVQV